MKLKASLRSNYCSSSSTSTSNCRSSPCKVRLEDRWKAKHQAFFQSSPTCAVKATRTTTTSSGTFFIFSNNQGQNDGDKAVCSNRSFTVRSRCQRQLVSWVWWKKMKCSYQWRLKNRFPFGSFTNGSSQLLIGLLALERAIKNQEGELENCLDDTLNWQDKFDMSNIWLYETFRYSNMVAEYLNKFDNDSAPRVEISWIKQKKSDVIVIELPLIFNVLVF